MVYEKPIDNAQFETCLRTFSCIDTELMNILEALQRKLFKENTSKAHQKSVKFNSQPPQIFTSFASPLRHTAEKIDLINLAKNAWYEKRVSGHIKFVNCYDEDIVIENEPDDGYIKRLPPNLRRSNSLAASRRLGHRKSLGLSSSLHGLGTDYATSDDDSETDKEEEKTEEKIKSREEQWEDHKVHRADYLYKHGFCKSIEKARDYVEMEQALWSRRGEYNGQIMVKFPSPYNC
jgi:hypothetical protein